MDAMLQIGLAFDFGYGFFREIARGIRSFAEERPEWHFTSIRFEEIHRLTSIELNGLIAAADTSDVSSELRRWKKPLVCVGAVRLGAEAPQVGVDNAEVGREAARHFLERGVRQFGFVGDPNWPFSIDRERAYRDAIEQAGFSVASYHDTRVDYDPSARRWPLDAEVIGWLKQLPKPAGILAPNDLWGMRLIEICRRCGVRVPEDVAVLGVDNDELQCELCRPALSSIPVSARQIGAAAAELLDRLLRGESAPAAPILVAPQTAVARGSTDLAATNDADVLAAVRWIRDNLGRTFTVSTVANEVSTSRRSLERRFRRALGRGIGEEIRRARLERARRLLIDTDHPVHAVAGLAGFSDYRHFSAAFRRAHGHPPARYRRQLRSKP